MALVFGFVGLRNPPGDASAAIRVGSASGATIPADLAAPQTPAPAKQVSVSGAISLPELVAELRARDATSTTRPRTTTTTIKKAVTTTAVPRSTTTVKSPAAGAPTTASITPLAPVTTLLAAMVPPAVAVPGAVTRTDSGVASWFHAPDGTCAHRSLPMGTMIKVTRIPSSGSVGGASTTCKVNDRGPTVATGRLIDLSDDTFEKLASKEDGLIDVRIEW